MRSLRCGWFVSLCFGVFTSFTLRADPVANTHPRVAIVADHLTLTFDQQPGPGGAQTVSVRSRSLVSVKPKEFLRLRVIVVRTRPSCI